MNTGKGFKTTKELEGTYIESRWNGMSDIFKVVGTSSKSVKLAKLKLEDLGMENEDPTWLRFRIAFENNEPKIEKKIIWENFPKKETKDNIITKRVTFTEKGDVIINDPSWDGLGTTSVIAMNDDEAKKVVISQWWN